jgi:hypothetical protein
MKKLYCIGMILFAVMTYSQKLFIMKYVNENSNISSYFSKVNTTNGSIISESEINGNEPPTFIPGCPTYDSQSDVIYAAHGNRIFKYNANDFSDYTSFGGAINSLQPYDEIVFINNRLFAVRTDNTGSMYYEITLYELDKNNGSVLNTRAWTIWYGTNGGGITFSSATNELFIVMGNNLSKYNIVTQELNVFNLPGLDLGTYYPGVIYAQNRLFVRKKDFIDNQVNNYIVEINKDTGAIIATNLLNPAIANYYYPRSQLAFLAQTNEIACLYYGSPSLTNENIIVKYNIDTHTDSIINLPSENTTATRTEDYRSLVSVDSEERLGVSQFQQNQENFKIKSVYNMLGQKVPLETYNQILIIEFENGQTGKRMYYKN